jgi:hypothetical protein
MFTFSVDVQGRARRAERLGNHETRREPVSVILIEPLGGPLLPSSQDRPPSNASTTETTSMPQHVSAALELYLEELSSDGTGQGPGGTNYTQLPDESMLKLLSRALNNDQARVQYWGESRSDNPGRYPLTSIPGTEINFLGSLPRGYSYWTHPTTGGGTMIPEVFGHPRGIRYRSAPDFLRHVDEILIATFLAGRSLALYNLSPKFAYCNLRVIHRTMLQGRRSHPRGCHGRYGPP